MLSSLMKKLINRFTLKVFAEFLKFHTYQTYIETFVESKLEKLGTIVMIDHNAFSGLSSVIYHIY